MNFGLTDYYSVYSVPSTLTYTDEKRLTLSSKYAFTRIKLNKKTLVSSVIIVGNTLLRCNYGCGLSNKIRTNGSLTVDRDETSLSAFELSSFSHSQLPLSCVRSSSCCV